MNKIKMIVPRGKWVLVLSGVKQTRETEQGLILPANEDIEQKAQGVVKSFGDEVKGIKHQDVVIFGAFAGENIKIQEGNKEVEYKLLMDEDIIAFVKLS